jgi:hypothetical protein
VADLSDFMIEQYERNGTVDDVRAMAAEIKRSRAELAYVTKQRDILAVCVDEAWRDRDDEPSTTALRRMKDDINRRIDDLEKARR